MREYGGKSLKSRTVRIMLFFVRGKKIILKGYITLSKLGPQDDPEAFTALTKNTAGQRPSDLFPFYQEKPSLSPKSYQSQTCWSI
ncbi:uncharacterized [Tachysurus ichikawai]